MARGLRTRSHGIGRDLLKGAVAGAVATFVMSKVTGDIYDDHERAASIHWALGIGAGAAYAVLRRRFQGLGTTAGTALGTAFWGFLEEGLVAAPRARGLVGHLTFGTVTDGTLRLLDRVA